MKKMIAMLLTPVMCLSLAACGSSTSSTSGETKADETKAAAAESTSAAGTTPTYDTVTLKLSHHNAVDQPIHEALTEWADMLKEKSDGAITIDIYPAASLYNSSDAETWNIGYVSGRYFTVIQFHERVYSDLSAISV